MRRLAAAITLLVLAMSGLVSSPASATDSGLQYVNRTTANGLGSNHVQAVYVVGSNVYAATDAGLSISTNGGTSFTNATIANGLGSNDVRSVFVVGNTIYAATADTTYGIGDTPLGGLSISTDGGAHFTNKNMADGLGSSDVNAVFVDQNTIYVGTSASNRAIATAPVTSMSITSNVVTLTTSTAHGLAVGSIVTVSGVDNTVDGIYSVTAVPSSTQFSYAKTVADRATTAVDPLYSAAVLKVSGGLSISINGGSTFTNYNSTALCGSVSCTSVRGIYASGSNIYLATSNHLVYSTNSAKNFTNASFGELSEKGVYADGSTVYVATGFGVQSSTNNFATEPTGAGEAEGLGNRYVTGVYVNGGKLYATTWGGLGISTNGGTTFTNDTTENCLGDDSVAGVFVSNGVVYAATYGGLSISTGPGKGCHKSGGGSGTPASSSKKSLTLTVAFAAGSSTLSAKEKTKLLRALANVGSKVTRGTIAGYVQRDGNSSNDKKLSAARARVIARFLADHGIKVHLVATGKGALNSSEGARKAVITLSYTK